MLVEPAPTAVTRPDVALTVATAPLLLLQDPPASPVLLYAADEPIQSGEVPLTVPAFAFGLTVKDCEDDTGLLQPVLTV